MIVLLIRNGHLEIVKYLVGGNHSNIEATSRSGWTPLHLAVE